jgi:hypothetical protein
VHELTAVLLPLFLFLFLLVITAVLITTGAGTVGGSSAVGG